MSIRADEKPDALDLAAMDPHSDPCSDFYQYANGGWLARAPIPADQGTWSRFNEMAQRSQNTLHEILEKTSINSSKASVERRIGHFYSSCMDVREIETAGIQPLRSQLDRIARISTLAELQMEVAQLHRQEIPAMFNFGANRDMSDSSQMIGEAKQGGLGLPDTTYYVQGDEQSRQVRDFYLKHISKMFTLLGEEKAKADDEAKTVLDIETALAKASLSRAEQNRASNESTYHRMDERQLRLLAPHFDWEMYFRHLGFPMIKEVNVVQPAFFRDLDRELTLIPIRDWRIYLRWQLIHVMSPSLTTSAVDENFDFYGRFLQGAKQLPPRWKQCVQATDQQLGDALGELYVRDAFSPDDKARVLGIAQDMIASLREELAMLDWLTEATRKEAIAKLDSLTIMIGYPDKWRDYSTFRVDHGPFVVNVLRGNEFNFNYQLSKIGKPIDKREWLAPVTASAVTAYNWTPQIIVPAGFLQPPIYYPRGDDAFNYGSIGVVIAHELTHNFDSGGREIDAHANLHNWWTDKDAQEFEKRAECFVQEFSSNHTAGDQKVDGKATLAENISDNGGLHIAYNALMAKLKAEKVPPVDSFSFQQRFFLAYAQIFPDKMTPEMERLRAAVEGHSPQKMRVNSQCSNMPEFQTAFHCPSDAPMVRTTSCRIW